MRCENCGYEVLWVHCDCDCLPGCARCGGTGGWWECESGDKDNDTTETFLHVLPLVDVSKLDDYQLFDFTSYICSLLAKAVSEQKVRMQRAINSGTTKPETGGES